MEGLTIQLNDADKYLLAEALKMSLLCGNFFGGYDPDVMFYAASLLDKLKNNWKGEKIWAELQFI